MTYERPSKVEYYLGIAEAVARRATYLRRLFGAVIVSNDQIISTGYAGAPRKMRNCIDIGRAAFVKKTMCHLESVMNCVVPCMVK